MRFPRWKSPNSYKKETMVMDIEAMKVEVKNAKAAQDSLWENVCFNLKSIVSEIVGETKDVRVEVDNENSVSVHLNSEDAWHDTRFNISIYQKRDEKYHKINEFGVSMAIFDSPRTFSMDNERSMVFAKIFGNLANGLPKIVNYVNGDEYKDFIPLRTKYNAVKYDYDKAVEEMKFAKFVDSLKGANLWIGCSNYNIVKVMANTIEIDRGYSKRIKISEVYSKVKCGNWKIER